MHFTRDPIIETIITPKEGYKLSIKSSKGAALEEYLVDAVEVISFGQTFFYRSLERPKSFLLPVSDYELAEVKEVRLAVKNPGIDKLIKIAGGKEPQQQAAKPQNKQAVVQEVQETLVEETKVSQETTAQPTTAARRDRRRSRRGKQRPAIEEKEVSGVDKTEENVSLPPLVFPNLLTPPTTLISETLFKELEQEAAVKNIETPINQESLSGNHYEEYYDPLFAPKVMNNDLEDKGLVSEEPRKGETLEEATPEEIEIPSHLNDHTHL